MVIVAMKITVVYNTKNCYGLKRCNREKNKEKTEDSEVTKLEN
jgi:hypothetical protein